jgi:hypothetical protein
LLNILRSVIYPGLLSRAADKSYSTAIVPSLAGAAGAIGHIDKMVVLASTVLCVI